MTSATDFTIREDDLSGEAVQALLARHLEGVRGLSPPCSVHALDLDGLRGDDVTFWSLWSGDELAGCGALKRHDADLAEIKSMRTADAFLRRGVGAAMLRHLLDVARGRGYRRVSLETGSQDGFAAARALYARQGFTTCGPFADYVEDPNSVFMTMSLADEADA